MKCPFQKKIVETYDYGISGKDVSKIKKTEEFEECYGTNCMAYSPMYGCLLNQSHK